MKILLISGAASFSTRDVWDGYVAGLRSIEGVEVIPYPLFSMLSVYSADGVCNDIIGKALDIRNAFDAVVFVDGLFFREAREWVPITLSVHGLLTAVIATDDPYEQISDRAYALRFTNDRMCASHDVMYLPTAANWPTISAGEDHAVQDIDVCFIGTVFEDRWPMIRALAMTCEERGWKFELRGHFFGQPEDVMSLSHTCVTAGTVTPEERLKLYRRSKLVLNVFRDHPTAESANPRIYETAALGYSALLTSRRKEVDELLGDSVYCFSGPEELIAQVEQALGDPEDRHRRIERAKAIVRSSHLYEHRAAVLLNALRERTSTDLGNCVFPADRNVCFIFGAPRTGSTWLLQMLSRFDPVVIWDEPRFGWIATALAQYPEEMNRSDAFFSRDYVNIWTAWIRQMFLAMAHSRWPRAAVSDTLVVKDVNATEFAPFFADFFPVSKYILLVRDPFDILDSLIDMQKPGSWNESYWLHDQRDWTEELKIKHLAKSIIQGFQYSLQGYKRCAEECRLRISYEQLLQDTGGTIRACVDFLGLAIGPQKVEAVVEQCRFGNGPSPTGQDFPRRFGRAGGWRESANFAGAVREIAYAELGLLRRELGYE